LSIGLSEYLQAVKDALDSVHADAFHWALGELSLARDRGSRVYICGNGGSASNADHFACDLHKAAGLKATALTGNAAIMTAYANDSTYSNVFAAQVAMLANKGDVVIGISTSGNSPNVIEAIREANNLGATTIALMGRNNGRLARFADVVVWVDSDSAPVVEDVHAAICHAITEALQ
jgi:D-sedoheptulose 7-phosphate isomerase